MKNTPLYKDLDTSFVNFDALVRYLRRRRFTGEIIVGSNGYEASVVFTDEGKLRVTEHDKISGTVIHGEKAFERIVTRAGQPGGNIDVLRNDVSAVKAAANGQNGHQPVKKRPAPRLDADKPANGLNGFRRIEPFDISLLGINARQPSESPASNGKHTVPVSDLLTELLETVDSALKRAKLDLAPAFAKASGEIADRHPIVDPVSGTVEYTAGKLIAEPEVSDAELVAAVGEVLGRIFARLESNPKFGKVYRFAQQRLRAFRRDRLSAFDDHGLSTMVDKLISE